MIQPAQLPAGVEVIDFTINTAAPLPPSLPTSRGNRRPFGMAHRL